MQDRVFLGGQFTDEDFRARRKAAFIVAVQCTTCFQHLLLHVDGHRAGGPRRLRHPPDRDRRRLRHPGRLSGRSRDRGPPAHAPAHARRDRRRRGQRRGRPDPDRRAAADGRHRPSASSSSSTIRAGPQVADRCVECGNCTMACPTCFCTSVVERSDMDGRTSVTERLWDSCFDVNFAKVAGGDFRARPRDRYRQWLTHKFSTWMDQFGSFGCVGCGRCITWCPVRIDVREELAAIAPVIQPIERPVAVEPVAASPGSYSLARLASVKEETEDTTTLSLTDLDPAFLAGRPGQFVMVALPAFPAVPISISRFRLEWNRPDDPRRRADVHRAGEPASGRQGRPPRSARHLLADRGRVRPARRGRRRWRRPLAAARPGRGARGQPRPLRVGFALLRLPHAGGPAVPRRSGRAGRPARPSTWP